jgi:hypothetical protein
MHPLIVFRHRTESRRPTIDLLQPIAGINCRLVTGVLIQQDVRMMLT